MGLWAFKWLLKLNVFDMVKVSVYLQCLTNPNNNYCGITWISFGTRDQRIPSETQTLIEGVHNFRPMT